MNKKSIFRWAFLIIGTLVIAPAYATAQKQENVKIGLAFNLDEIRLVIDERIQLVNLDDPDRKYLSGPGEQALIAAKPLHRK